jgi:hypothetical protein
VENTARVVAEINTHVLCLVEVESRPAMVEFKKRFLKSKSRYPYEPLIDGNDPRGIDVGIFSHLEIRACTLMSKIPAALLTRLSRGTAPNTKSFCPAGNRCGCCAIISRAAVTASQPLMTPSG